MNPRAASPCSDLTLSRTRVGDYLELTKPRLTLLVLFAVTAGFVTAPAGPGGVVRLLATLLGAWLTAAGGNALNMYLEREVDGRMRRTAGRPIPSGRLRPGRALAAGAALAAGGVLWLAPVVNPLSAALAALTAAVYLLLYTPLKRRSSLNTLVGAVAGALPVLLGHAAAAGTIGREGWFLAGILFLWQIPHFLAIAWIHREDYARAGCPMLSVLDPSGLLTARQIVVHSAGLLFASLAPFFLGGAGPLYLLGALLLGGVLIAPGIRFLSGRGTEAARGVFRASLAYLPALLLLYALLA